jgi:hypothetical protein
MSAPFSGPLNVSFDSRIIREALAKAHAIDLAGGDRRRIRPQEDGSVIVVNFPDFDTRRWDAPAPAAPKRRKAKKS